jgi:hypothetical protein
MSTVTERPVQIKHLEQGHLAAQDDYNCIMKDASIPSNYKLAYAATMLTACRVVLEMMRDYEKSKAGNDDAVLYWAGLVMKATEDNLSGICGSPENSK